MAVTLVVYIALAMATATALRPHYATPVTVRGWNNGAVWVISQWVKAPDGQVLSQPAVNSLAQHLPASVQNSSSPDAFTTWLTQHGYTLWQSVQPNSRFWQFQLTEGAWLLAVSACSSPPRCGWSGDGARDGPSPWPGGRAAPGRHAAGIGEVRVGYGLDHQRVRHDCS